MKKEKILSGILATVIATSSISNIAFAYEGEIQPEIIQSLAEKSVNPVSYGIPTEIPGQWEYLENNNQAETWMRGNAYMADLDAGGNNVWLKGMIDTKNSTHKAQYEKLIKDEFLSDVDILIIYLPNCPYSRSMMPKMQEMAIQSGAKVMCLDVTKFQTYSLLAYYNSLHSGAVSPIVLWRNIDENGTITIGGESGVHSTQSFADILSTIGCPYSGYLTSDSGSYSAEDEYRDLVLAQTNRQRIAYGLNPLFTFDTLEAAANQRAYESIGYYDHKRHMGDTDIRSFSDIFNESEYKLNYVFAGENICGGNLYGTPYDAVAGWMRSPAHRANILTGSYTCMGAGYYSMDQKETISHSGYAGYDSAKAYENNWAQLFTSTLDTTNIEVFVDGAENGIEAPMGSLISDLNLTLVCEQNGIRYTMPIIDEMCSGYNRYESGFQYVTVKFSDTVSTVIQIKVGDVAPTKLTEDMVKLSTNSVVYDGSAQKPLVTVSNPLGNFTLVEGYSYDIQYLNNVDPGTATVKIIGKGNFTGSVEKTFKIMPCSIEGATIRGVEDVYKYTGTAIEPSVSVTLKNGTPLAYGKDYTIRYVDNIGTIEKIRPGEAYDVTGTGRVVITGIGNYTGTIEDTFSFELTPVQKEAEILYFMTGSRTYSDWMDVKDKNNLAFEMSIEQIHNRIVGETAEKGFSLNDILTANVRKDIVLAINDFLQVYSQYGKDSSFIGGVLTPISTENMNIDPVLEINTDAVSVYSVRKDTEPVKLTITSISDPVEDVFNLDKTAYNLTSTVAVDISMENVDVSEKKPITITMPVPAGVTADESLRIMHFANPEIPDKQEEPVEIKPILLNGNVISFTVPGFSPFLFTNKNPVYIQPAKETVDELGSIGVTNIPEPSSVKVSVGSDAVVNVNWDAVVSEDASNILYRVSYADNEAMENAMYMDTDNTSATIAGLVPGTYYIRVSTLAETDWSSGYTVVDSNLKMITISKQSSISNGDKFTNNAPISSDPSISNEIIEDEEIILEEYDKPVQDEGADQSVPDSTTTVSMLKNAIRNAISSDNKYNSKEISMTEEDGKIVLNGLYLENTNNSDILKDLEKFFNTLYTFDNGKTVDTIVFNKHSYTWSGSDWGTLISDIASSYMNSEKNTIVFQVKGDDSLIDVSFNVNIENETEDTTEKTATTLEGLKSALGLQNVRNITVDGDIVMDTITIPNGIIINVSDGNLTVGANAVVTISGAITGKISGIDNTSCIIITSDGSYDTLSAGTYQWNGTEWNKDMSSSGDSGDSSEDPDKTEENESSDNSGSSGSFGGSGNSSSSSGSGSSSSGGSSQESSYTITLDNVLDDIVKVSTTKTQKGKTVTITEIPESEYEIVVLTVQDKDGNQIEVKQVNDTTYEFEMPGKNVTIGAELKKKTTPHPFVDVAPDVWYADAVQRAYDLNIMYGVSSTQFAPESEMTRAMAVTLLHRLVGADYTGEDSGFKDVAKGSWYADAVAWGRDAGIVTGVSNNKFKPNDVVTREQFITMLYRLMMNKDYDSVVASVDILNKFSDAKNVSDWAKQSMAWAVESGLVNGMGENTLSPDSITNRAQGVTLLVRLVDKH